MRSLLTLGLLALIGGGCSSVYTYSGTVVDGSGRPIELVPVQVMRRGAAPLVSTTADDAGRFSVEVARRPSTLVIGGWEVDAREALGDGYPTIALPGPASE